MLAAFAWGFVGAASLIIGAVLALNVKFSRALIGLIMAFGVGVQTPWRPRPTSAPEGSRGS